MDHSEQVNLTAEEAVEDDEELLDYRTLKLSAENEHLFLDHANGTVGDSWQALLHRIDWLKSNMQRYVLQMTSFLR